MKFKYFSFVVVTFLIFSISNVYAHPGRTDANGCHTCRTNCEKWGLSYGEYHCHNGGSSSSSSNSSGSSSSSSYTRQVEPTYVYGCTDSNATNYNSSANKDDGSCIAKVYGCMNQEADNYNGDANTADGTCLFSKEEIKYEKIKYKKKYKLKKSVKEGKVLRKGKKGKRKIVIKTTTNESNEIVSSEVISKETIKKPVAKIISTKKKSKVTKNK